MWRCGGGWGSRPVPQERGILIWAICNDRPTMSAEEWQVERLWQVLIAVRKSSWRMCQLHTLPFPSSAIAVVLCCLSLCPPFDLYLKGEWRILVNPPIFFSLPVFLYLGWHPGATTCQCNSFVLPPLPLCSHSMNPHLLFSSAVDSCWHSLGIKTRPVPVCPMVTGNLPCLVSLPKQISQYVINERMKKLYYNENMTLLF